MKTPEWRFLYKCRMCGAIDDNTVTGNKGHVLVTLSEVSARGVCTKFGIPVAMTSIHSCKNGDIGISDLQGAVEYPAQ